MQKDFINMCMDGWIQVKCYQCFVGSHYIWYSQGMKLCFSLFVSQSHSHALTHSWSTSHIHIYMVFLCRVLKQQLPPAIFNGGFPLPVLLSESLSFVKPGVCVETMVVRCKSTGPPGPPKELKMKAAQATSSVSREQILNVLRCINIIKHTMGIFWSATMCGALHS